MKIMGVPGGEVRPPRLEISDPAALAEIEKILRQSDVVIN